MRPIVRLLKLDVKSYHEALNIQKQCVESVVTAVKKVDTKSQHDIPHTLILVEHLPVYTIGIRERDYPLQVEQELRSLGAEFVRTNRGGLITFHGPGQLVAYPILYLGSFNTGKSIKWYVNQLEKTIIKVCHDFAIESSIICGLPGVWVEENRKIAAIGLHATRNVTMHGIAINCDVDLKWFQHIIPCGIKDKSVTSISNELKRNISINHVLPHFIQAFKQQFNCEIKE